MSTRTARWLECDHGYCMATYGQDRQRQYNKVNQAKLTLHAASRAEGWGEAPDHADLCAWHSEKINGQTAQAVLFPASEDDHAV